MRRLKRELPGALADLQRAAIAPADLPHASIGPGMGIFSRHSAVLEPDDTPMSVKAALQLINAQLDAFLNETQGEFDADTRFALTWFEQHGFAKGPYGSANSIAQARGVSVESVRHAGIVHAAGGHVAIRARPKLDPDWAPENDTHITVWECCQHLVAKLEDGGEAAAGALLARLPSGMADRARDLAYCLYDICSTKRRDPGEARAYNGLIAAWPDVVRQAGAAARSADEARQESLAL